MVEKKLECSVCKIFVTSQNALTSYLMGKQHRRKGERLNEVKEGLLLYRLGLDAHLKGRRHQENMEASMAKRDKERFCPKCQLVMDTEETWALHLSKFKHKVMDQNASEFKVEVEVIDIK